MKKRKSFLRKLVMLTIAGVLAAQVAAALSPNRQTEIAIGPPSSIDPSRVPIATVNQAADGSFSILVSNINRATGMRQGNELVTPFSQDRMGVRPVHLIFSTVLKPGSLLVLDSSLRIHEYPLGSMDDGTPFIVGGSAEVRVHGPFGDPAVEGEATAFAEGPSAAGAATAVIGTKLGQIIAILIGIRGDLVQSVQVPIATAPIDDLAVVPQIGYFAFVAVTGGHLIGINADANPRLSGLQPEVTFDLAGPGSAPHIIDIGAQRLDQNSLPLAEPAPVRIVAANGTPNVGVLEIPADPSFGRLLQVAVGVNRVVVDIAQVEFGSLVMLAADGTGVYYQPEFTLEGGSSGPTLTLAGATMEFDPHTLNLRSKGKYVTTVIEAANGNAASINTSSLTLQVDGVAGTIAPDSGFIPQLGDADGDGNPDLKVKFDRQAVAQLLSRLTTDTARVRASWEFTDGTVGAASAQIRLSR